jgi:lysophospholipase L1-like esterase
VQPNAAGTSVATAQGYPDMVYTALHRDHPELKLVQLGCMGETTSTMRQGGICHYRDGSQLADAVAFLHSHRGHIALVTIDIGANDPESCGAQSSLSATVTCIGAIPSAATHLTGILAALRAAAGPSVRIVGMSYYLPALAEWRHGMIGRATAWATERLAVSYNDLLGNAYAKANIAVADVFGAFDTTNFGDQQNVPGVGTVPRNVALICQWTWECAAPPRGPNQHANPAGYQVMATAILKAAHLS